MLPTLTSHVEILPLWHSFIEGHYFLASAVKPSPCFRTTFLGRTSTSLLSSLRSSGLIIFLCWSSLALPVALGDVCAVFEDDAGAGGLVGGTDAGVVTAVDDDVEDLRCTLGFGKFCFLSMASTSL